MENDQIRCYILCRNSTISAAAIICSLTKTGNFQIMELANRVLNDHGQVKYRDCDMHTLLAITFTICSYEQQIYSSNHNCDCKFVIVMTTMTTHDCNCDESALADLI